MQGDISSSATIVAVDQSLQQQQAVHSQQVVQAEQVSQQYSSEVGYQIIQQDGIQQVAYVNQQQVPFIASTQKVALSNGQMQVCFVLIK